MGATTRRPPASRTNIQLTVTVTSTAMSTLSPTRTTAIRTRTTAIRTPPGMLTTMVTRTATRTATRTNTPTPTRTNTSARKMRLCTLTSALPTRAK